MVRQNKNKIIIEGLRQSKVNKLIFLEITRSIGCFYKIFFLYI